MIRHNYSNREFGFDELKFITQILQRYAHKECGHDGEWFRHPLTNKTWSNYTKCVNIDDLELKHSIGGILSGMVPASKSLPSPSVHMLAGHTLAARCAMLRLRLSCLRQFRTSLQLAIGAVASEYQLSIQQIDYNTNLK
uniref:Uncharacterized protein n=1 Tax=Glossina palpalis gambiensis TaxID=67801 RepID=A0A1B0C3S6_9MUSC